MDDLTHIKQVIAALLADLQKDLVPERAGIKRALNGLFAYGVISFSESFDNFMATVGNDATIFDRWLSVQMQVFTDLGPQREELIAAFSAMFKKVLDQTDGGQAFIVHSMSNLFSYQCALMIRVYGDQLIVQDKAEEPPVEGEA